MSFPALLDDHQRAILDQEQRLLQRLHDLLAQSEPVPDDLGHLRRALLQLEDLFLLVVVGEFNSGKSALINALLGAAILPEGVTPTTDRIYLIRHGPAGPAEVISEDVRAVRFPLDLLREVHIVDTPGTNAVLRRHEALTRDFVPRSDLVIFVTSADRPFTESERSFLELLRQWGKKLVLVINKVDILESQAQVEEVERFVRDQAKRLLHFSPTVFSLSARQALRSPADASASTSDGFQAFRQHLLRTLSGESLLRLKLLTPIGVGLKISRSFLELCQQRLVVISQDAQTLSKVGKQIDTYASETRAAFIHHLARVDNELLEMRLRGEEFLDDRMRLWKIRDMLQGDRFRRAFEETVVARTPEQIVGHIDELIDWLVEQELRQWRAMADELNRQRESGILREPGREAAAGFTYNRQQLLDTLGTRAEHVVAGYDRTIEASRLSSMVQESVAMAGLVEVGAIGLGVLLKAVLVGAAADLTGLLAAGALGILGLAVIPFRRSVAKRQWRQKTEELRARLKQVVGESFATQMEETLNRLRGAIAPYQEFTHQQEERLRSLAAGLEEIQAELLAIQRHLEGGVSTTEAGEPQPG